MISSAKIYFRGAHVKIKDKRLFFTLMALVFILLTSVLVLVTPAHAYAVDFFTDPFGWIKENILGFVNMLLISICNGIFQFIMQILKALTPQDLLTADWTSLFGDRGIKANGMFTMMTNVCNGIVKPIASTILGAVFMMQFIKITTKADANGTVPMVKEIFVIFVIFMIFNWTVSHADDICGAIYDIANRIAIYVRDYGSTQQIEVTDIQFVADDGWDVVKYASCASGVLFGCIFILIIGLLGAIVCFVFAVFATYARALQLYIYATFAPIPMAMLGFEETRSWGVGYFRNFASVALASAILLMIMFAFPLILVACVDFSNMKSITDVIVDFSGLGQMTMLLKMLAIMLVFIIAVKNSGKYAKAILGA